MQNPANNRYYILDALGHTRALLDNQGSITDTYVYDAWGNRVSFTGTTPNPFTWNGAYGYEWIEFTGLYHVGAREYDPRVGRWLQRDPIGIGGGDPNLYRYCGNSPLLFTDPSGTDGEPIIDCPPQKSVLPKDPRWPEPASYPSSKSFIQYDIGTGKAIWVRVHMEKIQETIRNAYAIMYKYFPSGTIGNLHGPGDAYRHCVWACLVRKTLGKEGYHTVVLDHENSSAFWAKGKWDPISSPMDLANDEVGRKCSTLKNTTCEQACLNALKMGRLYVLPKSHWKRDKKK